MTPTIKTLETFCGGNRKETHYPITQGVNTYFTDGTILIRISKRSDKYKNTMPGAVFEEQLFGAGTFKKELYTYQYKCEDCSSGYVYFTSKSGLEYSVPCQVCLSEKILIGNKNYDRRKIISIGAKLKNVKFAPDCFYKCGGMAFVFSGGDGLIMPFGNRDGSS